jgi:EAL domain-containing protein (putative c-di-GMP-specific phosphodiesterase class I)
VGVDNLVALKQLGVRIAIDDFGTGYSSLNHLRHFPFDVLKIDKSFVAGVLDNQEDAAIVRLVMALAEATGAKVTAEGVETPDQAAFISSVGCALSQGYLFARPMPREEMRGMLLARVRFAA